MTNENIINNLTVTQLEDYLKIRYKKRGTNDGLFIKLVEEMGEVAEVLNQLSNRKSNSKIGDLQTELAFELVDVIHYVFAIAGINDIDLNKAIIDKDKKASIKYNHTPNLEEFILKL